MPLRVVRVLLSVAPFKSWPLHLRFFTADTHDMYLHSTNQAAVHFGKSSKSAAPTHLFDPVPASVTVILDLGGVAGDTGHRRISTRGVSAIDGPIDIKDSDFRLGDRVTGKWKLLKTKSGTLTCHLCESGVHAEVRAFENVVDFVG